jgi:hypothetical protein
MKSERDYSINNKINFLKSFEKLYNKTNIKLVCGHVDLALLQKESNI